jgi:hypothetical protein
VDGSLLSCYDYSLFILGSAEVHLRPPLDWQRVLLNCRHIIMALRYGYHTTTPCLSLASPYQEMMSVMTFVAGHDG